MTGRRGRPAPPLRILNYAINGLGLGHLTRLIAINRQIRRLATLVDQPTEILFLTSNEGDALAYQHGFASFKIPSKSAVSTCGLEPARYRKIAKQWVWNAINLVSPDILIVDTFPAGGFQELFDVFDFGSKNVFIYRAVRAEAALQPAFQSALRGYQRILMPREQGENDSPVPTALEDRVATTREILLRSVEETLEPAEARATLGLPADSPAVYLSVGGGGDSAAEETYAAAIEMARGLPEVRFVLGAGALYRGREFPSPNVTWTRRPAMIECFRAFDAAVVAGGYNTVWELMHCGVPCVFLPQPRTHDDQERRVRRCVEAGAGVQPAASTPDAIREALVGLLEPERQRRAAAAASGLVPINDALTAAEEILGLWLDPTELEDAAGILAAEPGALVAAVRAGHKEEALLATAHVMAGILTDAPERVLRATQDYLAVSQEAGASPLRATNTLRRAIRAIRAEEAALPEETESDADLEPRVVQRALELQREDL